MDMQYMSNKELYLKILDELGDKYIVGLHNSTINAYKFQRNFNKVYDIGVDCINEEMIVSNILRTGLCIPNRVVGLKSTVTFLDKITVDSFNYSYYQYIGDNKCYVLIIAIPKYVDIDDKRYNIQDMLEYKDIVNYSLFNVLLPREFIYGYYIKNVSYEEKIDSNTKELYYKCIFDDNMEFYQNDSFYGYMDNDSQRELWLKYFKDFNIDINLCSCNKKLIKRSILCKYIF